METALVTRRARNVGKHYIKVPLPVAEARSLARGFAILDRYPALLSEKGQQLAQKAEHFYSTAEQLPANEVQNFAQELIGQLPSKEKPHLELFLRPDLPLLEEAARKGLKLVKIEVVFGCENYCIFCLTDPPRKLSFMPYPMLLSIAETVQAVGGTASISFDRSDPLQYRDTAFGVNLADVVRSNGNIYLYCPSTHGWPERNKYTQAAAQGLSQQGKTFQSVSLHLLHEEFLSPEVPPETFDRYARRFIEAIKLLKPRSIDFRGLRDVPMGMKHLSLDYAVKYFFENIMPHLPAELQERYSEEGEWWRRGHRNITNIRERYGSILPRSIARNHPAGIHGGGFPGDMAMMGLSEMIVSVDGFYKLIIRENAQSNSHYEEGMLFG